MDLPLAHAWPLIQTELRRAVSSDVYDIWLAALRPRTRDGNRLVLEAPDALRAWVADRFADMLQTCAAVVLGDGVTVDVVARSTPREDSQGRCPPGAQAAAGDPVLALAPEPLNDKLTFGQFVIGDGNRFAHAAALAVAELPGQAYNPLFLYGPPGVGKTHLLQAIAHYVRGTGDGLTTRYLTGEAFTNAFVTAVGSRDHDRHAAFKRALRGVDVLLVDDVQFLERKTRTAEEFFHTFNSLRDGGAQLVLTSDRTPGDLGDLEARLRERFASGLVAGLARPDRHQRLAVLRKRAQHDGIVMADEGALEVVAERTEGNVRALEGAFIRVVAYHSLTGKQIDKQLAHEVLNGLYGPVRRAQPATSVEAIQAATCEVFGIRHEELVSADRSARLAWPRQLAMYLAREHTSESLPSIARRFGGRNHTTVLHACRRAATRLEDDAGARIAAARIGALLDRQQC
ncbi:MAG: chromosomal replication initiator protein DnaA [Actinomycetota bacterium]|nr:chromosomal replication initiator protein DnaA [Actinomycetota bacterium]